MYELESKVSFSETDSNLELSLDGLVNYLQDVAIFDSENGKATIEYLYERNMAWLLGSWQVIIERMPKMSEEIYVSTIPYEFKGFLGYRNFMVKNKAGEILVRAASIWSLIDMKELKPLRITQELIEAYDIGEKLDMDYKPRKIRLIGTGERQEGIKIRKSQIDSNNHLNNAEYVSICLDFISSDKRVKELRVEYKNAVYLNEVIYPVIYGENDILQISLEDDKNEIRAVVEVTLE